MHVTLAKSHEAFAAPKAFANPAKNELVSFLKRLKADLRISELDPEQKQVTLSIDGYIVSMGLIDGAEVEFYAAHQVDVSDEALLKEMLAGNLLGHAYDQWLTLTRRLPIAGLEYRMFVDALESFVNHWEHWHKRLQVKPKPTPASGRYIAFA
jgi:hypothetical protein